MLSVILMIKIFGFWHLTTSTLSFKTQFNFDSETQSTKSHYLETFPTDLITQRGHFWVKRAFLIFCSLAHPKTNNNEYPQGQDQGVNICINSIFGYLLKGYTWSLRKLFLLLKSLKLRHCYIVEKIEEISHLENET